MSSSKMVRLLIVDDSPESIDILISILPLNYKYQIALSGEESLKILDSSKEFPDLIFLDIMMPGMDGYELCKTIKENDNYKDIPVIFISSLEDNFNKVRGFQVGGADYITKPFQCEEVLARLNVHLELRHARNELEYLLSKILKEITCTMSDLLSVFGYTVEVHQIADDLMDKHTIVRPKQEGKSNRKVRKF
jgi:PleD family two-component response regulator